MSEHEFSSLTLLNSAIEALNLLFPHYFVVYYRKWKTNVLKVIYIESVPNFEDLFKIESVIKWINQIDNYGWHDYDYLWFKDRKLESDELQQDLIDKYYDIDYDSNFLPKFKSFFDELKETSELAQKNYEKWFNSKRSDLNGQKRY